MGRGLGGLGGAAMAMVIDYEIAIEGCICNTLRELGGNKWSVVFS